MTERKPLGLSAEQKLLRAQRTRALERLANPTPEPEGGWPAPDQRTERVSRFSPDAQRSAPPRDDRPQRPARPDGAYQRNDRPDRSDRDRSAWPSRGGPTAQADRGNAPFRPAARGE